MLKALKTGEVVDDKVIKARLFASSPFLVSSGIRTEKREGKQEGPNSNYGTV